LTLANKVTLARIASIPLCLVFIFTGFYGLAAVVFIIISSSDLIDGYIARKYHQVSEVGKMLDPLADKILVLSVLIALTGIGKADPLAVILICTRELIVSSIRTKKNFAANLFGKWKTFVQVAAILLLMLHLPFAEVVLWISVILSLFSGGVYLWQSNIISQLRSS